MKYFDLPANYRRPVLGVVTAPKTQHNSYPLPQGKESRIYREMIQCSKDNGLFMYYFYPDGVNWDLRKIRGHYWMKNAWVRREFPFPDIVYNRIVHRSYESRKNVLECLNKFENSSDVIFFNSRFLDKFEVYQALEGHPEAHKILPHTDLFSYKNLIAFASSYDDFFIKPRSSNTGKGIFKAICLPRGELIIARSSKNQPQWKRVKNYEGLYKRIMLMSGKPEEEFILQKGIHLACYQGRIFDLRVLVQKDKQGQWTYIGSGIRMAGHHRFVTHIPNGGTRIDPKKVILNFSDQSYSFKHFEEEIRKISQWVPYELESKLGLSLGVLSMDIGIDQAGQIQLIEVNSKPASFDEKSIRKKHLLTLNEYFDFVYPQSKR